MQTEVLVDSEGVWVDRLLAALLSEQVEVLRLFYIWQLARRASTKGLASIDTVEPFMITIMAMITRPGGSRSFSCTGPVAYHPPPTQHE